MPRVFKLSCAFGIVIAMFYGITNGSLLRSDFVSPVIKGGLGVYGFNGLLCTFTMVLRFAFASVQGIKPHSS